MKIHYMSSDHDKEKITFIASSFDRYEKNDLYNNVTIKFFNNLYYLKEIFRVSKIIKKQ